MLGQYRAIAKLGFGGMAEVRLALAQRAGGFNKLLVLKLLREELAADPEFLEMFLAEARVAALLNHPNIVQTNEVGTEDGRYFMAMEYLEGQPLSALFARIGRKNVPLHVHVFVLAQILHGLHYAHELADLNGAPLLLIHRDVSPQNVFLTYAGQVKLLDFGIAKIAGAAGLTKHGILKGKIGYMAPEQARMATDLDRRADIFAVGVMLWEALAQQRFVPSGESEVLTIQRRLSNEDRKLVEVAPDADPALAEICAKGIHFDVQQRWPDAQTFAEALEGWLPKPKHVIEKELGSVLADTFRQERSRIRRIVEEESAKPAAAESSAPDLREILSNLEGGTSGARDAEVLTGVATSELAVLTERRKARRNLTVVAAIGLVSVAGLGGLLAVKGAASQTAGTSQTAEPRPGPTGTISIRIRANPPNATISVDEGPGQAAPYETTAPRDEARHAVKITADGYQPEERAVAFGNDVDLEVSLRKAAGSTEPTTSAATNAARPQQQPGPYYVRPGPKPKGSTTQPDAPTAPTKKPKHTIDETDPYAQ